MAGLLRLLGLGRRLAASSPAPGGAAATAAAGARPADPWADPSWIPDVMKEMRSLLQRTGSLLGAAATALLGGLGYTQLHNIFPIPRDAPSWTHVVLYASVPCAFGGAVWLAAIFFIAQRQILIGTYWDDDLHGEDDAVAGRVEGEYARQENAVALRDVELRALRLAGVARAVGATDPERAKAAKDESDRLLAVVHLGLVRTAATILEYRSKRAFRGWPTVLALTLAVAGIVGIFGVSDYYKGQRDLYQAREKCAQAEAAGLVDACAAFETATQTAQRRAAEARLAQEAAAKAAAALAGLSLAERRILTRTAACESAIEALPKPDRPSSASRQRAVARCAATP